MGNNSGSNLGSVSESRATVPKTAPSFLVERIRRSRCLLGMRLVVGGGGG